MTNRYKKNDEKTLNKAEEIRISISLQTNTVTQTLINRTLNGGKITGTESNENE